MGTMQFLIPRRSGLPDLIRSCAYMVGQDGIAWKSHVHVSQNQVSVARETRDSGRLITPWPVASQGMLALTTTMLTIRPQPYHLALEVCRGTLSRLLDLFAKKLMPAEDEQALREARHWFIRAALRQGDVESSAAAAQTSLDLCLQLITKNVLSAATHDVSPPLSSTLTGYQLNSRPELAAARQVRAIAGNALIYGPSWCEAEPNPGEWDLKGIAEDLRQIKKMRRLVVCGPLFRLERDLLPDWLYLWDGDMDALQSYLVPYIETVVAQLKSLPNAWLSSTGTNVDRELSLSEEQRLRLTLVTLETIRRVDPQTPILIGVKQPWGDYMGHRDIDLSPWQFVDILLRADLGISGIVLEIELDYCPQCTMPRDLLETKHLIEHWSNLQLPLVFVLSSPTSDTQAAGVLRMIDFLQTQPAVQGIIWGQWRDRSDRHLGITDLRGRPKPILKKLQAKWARRGRSNRKNAE